MKRSLLLMGLMAALPAVVQAENAVKKAEQKVEQAAQATGEAVETAANKTGKAIKKGAEKTGDAVKKAAKKTEEAVVDGAKATENTVEKAAKKTSDGAKKVGEDVTNSETYRKIEKELGKPFSPEQREKYAEAWKAAKAKVRDAEQSFVEEISKITGLGKRKTKQIVNDSGM